MDTLYKHWSTMNTYPPCLLVVLPDTLGIGDRGESVGLSLC